MIEQTEGTPSRAVADRILALADEVELRDGAPPLSDEARLHLGDDARQHVVTWETGDGGAILGYAQRHGVEAEVVAGSSTEIAPSAIAMELLEQLEVAAPELTVWSHGIASPLAGVLEQRGYDATRVLWQLHLADDVHWPEVADDGQFVIRPYSPADEAAFLHLNAIAFAEHPEQGAWTSADVQARLAADWYEPAGFLVAQYRDSDELAGFHWTKIHPDGSGEVYVLAVAPQAQGHHLGELLLNAGLTHLRTRGVTGVLLYVDDSNQRALRLYEKAGFTRANKDVQLRRLSVIG